MPWSESIPQFSLAGTILGVVLLVYAAAGEPLLGRFAYRRVSASRERDPRALVRFYGLTLGIQWAWAAAIAAAVLLSSGVSWGDLGLRAPSAWGPLIAAGLGFALALAVIWVLSRASRSGRPGPALAPSAEPGGDVIAGLAPQTRGERRMAAALAVTAGVCEELLYRGLLTVLGVSFGLPVWAAAVLSCVLFALAHLYQGWWGLVGPGVLGALLMVLYLGTGSLLFPILLHIAVEARSLLFTGRGRRHAGRGSRRGRRGPADAAPEQAPYDGPHEEPSREPFEGEPYVQEGRDPHHEPYRAPYGAPGPATAPAPMPGPPPAPGPMPPPPPGHAPHPGPWPGPQEPPYRPGDGGWPPR